MASRAAAPTAKAAAVRPGWLITTEQVEDARPRPPSQPPPRRPTTAVPSQAPSAKSAQSEAFPPSSKAVAVPAALAPSTPPPPPSKVSAAGSREAPDDARAAPLQAKSRAPALMKAPARAPTTTHLRQQQPGIHVVATSPEDELGIHGLVCGEYRVDGTNHGRKFYKKVQTHSSAEDVHLYFWDERDGEEFTGWYFGDEVGGQRVWLHSHSVSVSPPKSGWAYREGEVRDELLVLSSSEKEQYDWEQTQGASAGTDDAYDAGDPGAPWDMSALDTPAPRGTAAEEWQEEGWQEEEWQEEQEEDVQDAGQSLGAWRANVDRARSRVATVEAEAGQAFEMAQLALDETLGLDDESVERSLELLKTQRIQIQQAQRAVAAEGLVRPDTPQAVKEASSDLSQRLRAVLTKVAATEKQLGQAKTARARKEQQAQRQAQEEERQRELESRHAGQLENMLQACEEKVQAAEVEVDKAAMAAAPLEVEAGDDLRSVMLQAVRETEQCVKAATIALTDAKRVTLAKMTQAKRMVQGVKGPAIDRFAAHQERINALQAKLTPYASVRQNFEQRAQSRKVVDDLNEKLSQTEMDVEKAAIACNPIAADGQEAVQEAEQAVVRAKNSLAKSSMEVDAKLQAVPSGNMALKSSLEEIKSRLEQLAARQRECQESLKGLKEKAHADGLVREAVELASTVDTQMQRMAGAEAYFMEDEVRPELSAIVQDLEKMASEVKAVLASTELTAKRMLTDQTKAQKGPEEVVIEALEQVKARLEEGKEQLKLFNENTAVLKRKQVLSKAEAAVEESEEYVREFQEVIAALLEAGQTQKGDTAGFQEAMQKAMDCDKKAHSSVFSARKSILDIASELRRLIGGGSPEEITKLQARATTVQEEITKLRAQAKHAEERLKARGQLSELIAKVQATETEAEKAAETATALAQGSADSEAVEGLARGAPALKGKAAALKQLIAGRLKSATRGSEALREELLGLQGRLEDAEAKLGEVTGVVTAHTERQQAEDIASQAVEFVEKVEQELAKVAEAEMPFLTGAQDLSGEAAVEAVSKCEASQSAAAEAIAKARTYVAKANLDAKRMPPELAGTLGENLSGLAGRLKEASARLAEAQQDMLVRRRSVQQHLVNAKVRRAEVAIKRQAKALEKFSEERFDSIGPEEARTLCARLAAAEREVSDGLLTARDLLKEQQKQVKSQAEPSGALAAEMAKAQERVNEIQAEAVRLSRECQRREQSFVAHQMMKESPESIDSLEASVEKAHKVSTPLLSNDRSSLLRDMAVRRIQVTLKDHLKKAGQDAAQLFLQVSDGASASVKDLGKFLDSLQAGNNGDAAAGRPDLPGNGDAAAGLKLDLAGLDGEEAATAIVEAVANLEEEGKDRLTLEGLEQFLRDYWTCIERVQGSLSADGTGETVIIEVGEVVQVVLLGDADDGALVECTLARDGSSVWVERADFADGSARFEPCTLDGARMASIVAFVEAVHSRCSEVVADAERKATACQAPGGPEEGPLAELRTTLQGVKSKGTTLSGRMETLKKRISASKALLLTKWQVAQSEAQAAQSKAKLGRIQQEAVQAVENAEDLGGKVVEGVKAGKAVKEAALLEGLRKTGDEAVAAIAQAQKVVSQAIERLDADKQQGLDRAVLDTRVLLLKLKSRVASTDRKTRLSIDVLGNMVAQSESKQADQARKAISAAVRRSGRTCDELFEEHAQGAQELSDEKLGSLAQALPDLVLDTDKVVALLRSRSPSDRGVRRSEFADVAQEFYVVSKRIALTASSKIDKTPPLRLLKDGEMLELLQDPQSDGTHSRGNVRALSDGLVGWVTFVGVRGSIYLESSRKPFMVCSVASLALQESKQPDSAAVTTVGEGEILEVLEGPHERVREPELLLRGKAVSDGREGCLMLRDTEGETTATQEESLHICLQAIAMTDVPNLRDCSILRKLDVGEALELLPSGDEGNVGVPGIERKRFFTFRDKATGWVSITGSSGTAFIERSKLLYRLQRRAALCRPGSEEVVRWLEAGEVFLASGPPEKGERPAPRVSVRVRTASSDALEGWVTWVKSGSGGDPLQMRTT